MRSWLGKLCFVLLKKRQTWAASGSSLPNSAGLVLIPAMPSWKLAKASVLDRVPRALSKVFERSKRTSFRLPRMSAVFLDLLVVLVLLLVLGLWVLLGPPLVISEAVPVLVLFLLVLAGAERSDCSGLKSPVPLSAGLRGNRKSCSVEVGLIEVRGLDVDMAAMSYGRVESALNGASWGRRGGEEREAGRLRPEWGEFLGLVPSKHRPETREDPGRLYPTFGWSHLHTHTHSPIHTHPPYKDTRTGRPGAGSRFLGGPGSHPVRRVACLVLSCLVCDGPGSGLVWSLVRRAVVCASSFFSLCLPAATALEESTPYRGPGECAQAEQRSPRSKQQPGPLKVGSHALANQGR